MNLKSIDIAIFEKHIILWNLFFIVWFIGLISFITCRKKCKDKKIISTPEYYFHT